MAAVECPFCGYRSRDGELAMQLHIEEHHTEDSPFVPQDEIPMRPSRQTNGDASSSEESMPADTWTKCTRPGCGAYVLISDADDHIALHEAEATTGEAVEDEAAGKTPSAESSPRRRRKRRSSKSQPPSAKQVPDGPRKQQKATAPEAPAGRTTPTLRDLFSGTSYHGRHPRPPPPKRLVPEPLHPGRLGKRELGPQAFEKIMPSRVRQSLLNDALPQYINCIGRDGRLYRDTFVANETKGLVPILSDLCALDPDTEATYFCDPNVKHIVRLNCEGNFCGYWNIQMMLSHIRGRSYKDREELQLLPNVLQIQDTIEQAWDNGICSYGRIETGGVRGTRKWIGTHETVAYFTQTGVRVEALSFQAEEVDGKSQPAVISLLDHVEAYYMSGLDGARRHRTSHITLLAPIYFQRFGHSMTIMGLERKRDGSRNLLVFDPSFATSNAMRRVLGGGMSYAAPINMLKAYRRSDVGLSGWKEFEIVVPQPYEEKRAS